MTLPHAPADPRALYRAMMRSTYIRLGLRAHGRSIIESVRTILGPRCYRGYGVGGPHTTTTLITVLPAASAATAFLSGRKSERLFIEKLLMERKQNSCAIVVHTSVGQRIPSALGTQAFPIRGACSGWSDDCVGSLLSAVQYRTCKHCTSNIAKSYVKWLRWKQWLRYNSHENKCATNYSIVTNNNWNDAYNKQLTKHDTNDDVDTLHLHFKGRVAYMHWVCTHCASSTVCDDAAHSWLKFWAHSYSSTVIFMGAPLWLVSPLSTSSSSSVCPRHPLPPRAVPWAPLHEHGKPALLRCRREWGHPERLHLSHRTAQKLFATPTWSAFWPGAMVPHWSWARWKSYGQACQWLVLHSNCLRLPREACFDADSFLEFFLTTDLFLASSCLPETKRDLMFYGQWTNVHVRSHNGPKLVTNDYLVWSHTFIIHVTTNSIVMLETLPNNADWDCFKTPILNEILRTQSQLLEEQYASLEVKHMFQSVGCVRNKLQFRTVQQNQKSSLWTLEWD